MTRQSHPAIDAEEKTLIAGTQATTAKARSGYGSRRLTKALQEEGFQVGRHKVRRLIKETGVSEPQSI